MERATARSVKTHSNASRTDTAHRWVGGRGGRPDQAMGHAAHAPSTGCMAGSCTAAEVSPRMRWP